MLVVYQQVKWNNVFEVFKDKNDNLFIFKNGSFWKSVNNVETAKVIIENQGKPEFNLY